MATTSVPTGARVLVVDDNSAGRYAKARVLQLAGFEVSQAATGQAALDAARSERPELMLLDVRLPDINGRHVSLRLRNDPETAEIAILQTSATHTDSHHRVLALEAGADAYLVEPVEPEELIATVRALLRMRRAESRLRVAESRFREMAESIGDVFWIFDPAAKQFDYVSPAFATVWGRPASDAIVHMEAWLDAVHPEDRERAQGAFEARAEGDGHLAEFRIVRPDGSERWIANRAFAMQGAARGVRVAGVAQDITDRKHADDELRRLDRRKDEFLAMLAHELRNPLGPIRNAVELLRAESGAETKETARQMIGRQVKYLGRLVDDLLDVSRITDGKISLRKEVVELSPLVNAAIDLARPALDAAGHTLAVTLPQEPLWVEADPVRVTQVVANLLNNAAKFTPHGGRINLQLRRAGERASLVVSDNGIGMGTDLLADIFELFTQGDSSLERSRGGLGLGLPLVKGLVEMHGGEVTASSAGPGQGSRFEVLLDLVAAPVKAEPVDAPAAKVPGQPRRILVVDDSRDSAEAFAMLLMATGHDVETAFDPYDALAKAKVFRPDVIFLDIGLPDMDGYTLAGKMREMPEVKGARMLALTGYGQAEYRARALKAGFDEHIVKPLDPSKLAGLLG